MLKVLGIAVAIFMAYCAIGFVGLLLSPPSESWCEQQTVEVQREQRGCAAHDRADRRH